MLKLKGLIKFTVSALAAALLFVLAWYASYRVLSNSNALRTYELETSTPKETTSSDDMLKVGGFNIAHGRGGKLGAENWQNGSKEGLLEHLDLIAAQIRLENLDIIVLNEVDFSAKWSFNINQAAYIAEQAGYPYVVEQRNMDVDFPLYEFKFGNAVLSRYPTIKSDFVEFQPSSVWEDIFVGNHDSVFSTLDTPLGHIGILGIHLEYRSEEIRVEAARKIKALTTDYNFPIVAVGDFNSTPSVFPGTKTTRVGENAIDYLLNEGDFQAPSNISSVGHLTFPSEQPRLVIDWVLENGSLELTHGYVVQSNLSDHLMVAARLGKPTREDQ